MKQCIKCLNENISTIVDKNLVFYHCHNCESTEGRALDTSSQIIATKENGLIKHITVAALVRKNEKILFTNRKNFPFGLCFPCGHLEYNEKPQDAISRELLEEVGIIIKQKKIIFHETIFDQCKAGGDLHEWYLYDCETEGDLILNSEMDNIVWLKESELKKANIVTPAKIVLSKIGLLDASSLEKLDNSISDNIPKFSKRSIEEAVIENLPMAIVTTKKNNELSFFNKSARELLKAINKSDSTTYNYFLKTLRDTAKTSIEKSIEISCSIRCNTKDYEIKSNPLTSTNEKFGATLIIKSVSAPHKQDVKDVIAYQSSLALSSSLSSSKIIKTILKQLMFSFDIESCNLMTMDNKNRLRIVFEYCKNEKSFKQQSIASLKIGEGIAGKVAKLKAPLAIPDTSLEPSFIKKSKHSYSLLSLPVISSNKVLGILNITRLKSYYFTEEEVSMSTIVANRIALALENDKLYQHLNKKKKTLETVLSTTTDGLIMVDKNYELIFANNAAIQMLPLKNKDLENLNIKNYLKELSTENSEKLTHHIVKAISLKKSTTTDFVSQKRNEKIVRAIFNPALEKNGSCKSVLIGLNDITKLESKQEQVKKQMRQLTDLFKISSMSIVSQNFFKDVLKKTAKILDSTTADVYFFNSEDDQTGLKVNSCSEIPVLIQQIITTKPEDDFICNNVREYFNNIKYIKKIIISPLLLQNKTVGVLYAINKDKNYNNHDAKWLSIIANRLSSRLETAKLFKELENDQQQIKSIIENSGDGIIVGRTYDSKVIVWNKAMEHITGFENLEDFKKENSELVSRIKEIWDKAIKEHKNTIYKTFEYRNCDGVEQWVGVTFSFVKIEGKVEYIIFNVRDISQDKTVETRNKEFIYTTTHELRTPITVIKGYLSMILNGDAGEVNPRQRLYFNRVYRSTDKLVLMVEDLLKTAKIEENKIIFIKNPFNSARLIADVIIDFKQKAKNKKIDLKVNGISDDIKLLGDYDKTKQALSNLVDNAIKYTAKGNIVIKNGMMKNFGVITVEDTGVGIPKKDWGAIFNKFYRVQNSESIRAGGTGLGLFIVKNLVEKQDGKMEITSKLGKGTRISILLPLVKNSKIIRSKNGEREQKKNFDS